MFHESQIWGISSEKPVHGMVIRNVSGVLSVSTVRNIICKILPPSSTMTLYAQTSAHESNANVANFVCDSMCGHGFLPILFCFLPNRTKGSVPLVERNLVKGVAQIKLLFLVKMGLEMCGFVARCQ